MKRFRSMQFAGGSFWRRATVLALMVCLVVATSPFVMAAKKKKEEAAKPTKSYTMPYMIVIVLVSVGLMTVARPGRRADKSEQKVKQQEEE